MKTRSDTKMMKTKRRRAPKIYLSEFDYDVLDELVRKHEGSRQAELLEDELSRAEVLSDAAMPPDVVTLHSRARVLDEFAEVERELTLVPSNENPPEVGKISVLAPLGAAMIGLSEGQAIDWPMPTGKRRRFRVLKVLDQPEVRRRLKVGSGGDLVGA